MLKKYKAILFDMDGVITDTMPYHFEAWHRVFTSMGIQLDKLEIYKREGEQGLVSITQLADKYGLQLSLEEKEELLREKEKIFNKIALPTIFPGISQFIRSLKDQGYLLGLVTGTSRKELEHILPKSIYNFFHAVVTGDSVKQGKPAPDPYCKCMNQLHIRPEEALVIENAPYGIKAAKQAGAFCIAIATSLPAEYLHEADIVYDSIAAISQDWSVQFGIDL
ncbi:MAG: HAD family hydrolase [bacterium]